MGHHPQEDMQHGSDRLWLPFQVPAQALGYGQHPLAHRQGREDVFDGWAAVRAMRRALHEGQPPRPWQEKATRKSWPHAGHRARAKP